MAHRHRLRLRTIETYSSCLKRLGRRIDLDNVNAAERVIPTLSKGEVNAFIAAYNLYCDFHKLRRADIRVNVDRRRKLPKLPSEATLQASLVIPRRHKWRAYLRLLYEVGARPSEPFDLKVGQVKEYLDKERIPIGTGKLSGDTDERVLPISPLLVTMLKELCNGKTDDDWLFTQTLFPKNQLNYHTAERLMAHVKKRLQATGHDVRNMRLHIYRHAFGTRLFHATDNLLLVARALGHRDLRTTSIYIHVQPDQPKRYDVINCQINNKEAISQQIAEGWELALQTPDTIYFKRPRWVP